MELSHLFSVLFQPTNKVVKIHVLLPSSLLPFFPSYTTMLTNPSSLVETGKTVAGESLAPPNPPTNPAIPSVPLMPNTLSDHAVHLPVLSSNLEL